MCFVLDWGRPGSHSCDRARKPYYRSRFVRVGVVVYVKIQNRLVPFNNLGELRWHAGWYFFKDRVKGLLTVSKRKFTGETVRIVFVLSAAERYQYRRDRSSTSRMLKNSRVSSPFVR